MLSFLDNLFVPLSKWSVLLKLWSHFILAVGGFLNNLKLYILCYFPFVPFYFYKIFLCSVYIFLSQYFFFFSLLEIFVFFPPNSICGLYGFVWLLFICIVGVINSYWTIFFFFFFYCRVDVDFLFTFTDLKNSRPLLINF